MKCSELDKLAKECEYKIDRNTIRTKYRTRFNYIEIANDIPDTIYFSTSKCGFLDIEFFKKCIELAETPLEEREDEKNLDSIIHRLKEIQTDAEDVMSWTDAMSWKDVTSWIKELYKKNWELGNKLKDIIGDLDEI